MNRTTALITAGALGVAPFVTLIAASPATADTTKRGVCGQGSYEFQVDREARRDGGGFDVDVELDRLTPGSRWSVVIKHDGKRAIKVTRTADSDGELDVDIHRRNTRGTDTFRFKAVSAGGGATCAAAITVA